MKFRTVTFAFLVAAAFAYAVKCALENPEYWIRASLFGFTDSLLVVWALYLAWEWVDKRRTVHMRGIARKLVFGVLLAWALVDAFLSGLEAPAALHVPGWIGIVMFFFSLGWSLVFITIVYLAWNWVAGRRNGVPPVSS